MHACAKPGVAALLGAALALSSLSAPAQTAHAQQAGARSAPARAVQHYRQGRRHFASGRYQEAIVELEAALALDPNSPNLIYNVAYTSELLGDLDKAIHYYHRYVRALPRSERRERRKARQTLKRLESHRQLVVSGAAERGESLRSPGLATGSGNDDELFWLALGSGAALLAGGGVTGVLALDRENDVAQFVARGDGDLRTRTRLADEADTLALATDILLAAGAISVVTAALLYFVRAPEGEELAGARIAPLTIASDGRGAMLRLSATF